YGLSDIGALRGGHAESLSAKRLREARRKLAQSGAVCIFGEPQLPARQLAAAAENTGVRIGVLDPLGANLTPGASLYFELMLQMGRAFSECLSPPADKN
ncbi:MAG: metal ABC transporter solute-binding protein, Zn/Mn family, partial [Gammaproteobacteria bacterium]